MIRAFLCLSLLGLTACKNLDEVGRAPEFTPVAATQEYSAIYATPMPENVSYAAGPDNSSLWSASRESLLGDQRAAKRGDILTVVIEINDKADISNSSDRSRSAGRDVAIPNFFGIAERAGTVFGALDPANLANMTSTSDFAGEGSVSRNEKLTLRVAATIVEEMPNGVLRLEGTQEVRVNYELRELLVTGFVRPQDISRHNEVIYDKIAGARISYGGRGQISEVQQPRWGDQITEILTPY